MDRQTAYAGELPVVSDYLQAQQNAMVALGEFIASICGTTSFVTGLSCTPTSPTANLSVVLGAGCIYQSEPLEATTWSALNANTTYNVMKQGISLAGPSVAAFTPPSTSGYSQVFLIEAQYQDSDTNSEVLPYFNPAILTTPGAVNFSGPGNNGAAQATARLGILAVQVKAGVAATTGTQVAPTADTGWVPLYAITLANGQTQITSGSIAIATGAPFLTSTLNGVGAYVQSGAPVAVTDTGSVNALAVAPNPAPASIVAGMQLRVKVAHTLTTSSTLVVTLASGTQTNAITRADTSATQYGDLIGGQEVDLTFDGLEWQIPRAVSTGSRTPVSDAAYSALPTDRNIAYTTLTASRIVSLPSAASYPTGVMLWVFDETGNASNSKSITLSRNGSDTIDGGTSTAITGPYGIIGLESNGSNAWTIIHSRTQTTGRTAVADAAYSMLATDRQIAYTSISAARTITALAAATFAPGTQFIIRDDSESASNTNTISLAPNGTDTINGVNATTVAVKSAGALALLETDGVSKWFLTIGGSITGQVPGSATNDSAAAGCIGEYISSVIAVGSAVGLTTTTPANLTSISLSAGDWDVDAVFDFTGGTTTTVTSLLGSISQNTATLDFTNGRGAASAPNGSPGFNDIPAGTALTQIVPPVRFSLASTTTLFAVAEAVFGTSTCSVYGILRARRVR